MLVKMALAILFLWMIALLVPYEFGETIYAFPPIAIIMIMVSGYRRRIKNPYDY